MNTWHRFRLSRALSNACLSAIWRPWYASSVVAMWLPYDSYPPFPHTNHDCKYVVGSRGGLATSSWLKYDNQAAKRRSKSFTSSWLNSDCQHFVESRGGPTALLCIPWIHLLVNTFFSLLLCVRFLDERSSGLTHFTWMILGLVRFSFRHGVGFSFVSQNHLQIKCYVWPDAAEFARTMTDDFSCLYGIWIKLISSSM